MAVVSQPATSRDGFQILPPPATRIPSKVREGTPAPELKSLLQIHEHDYRRPISPLVDAQSDDVDRLRALSETPTSAVCSSTPRAQSAGSARRPYSALAPAFELRQYSSDRKRLLSARRPQSARLHSLPLEYIDLLGGNGRWRQRKAMQEWERKQHEEEELRARRREEEAARRRRKVELAARKKKQAEEEERQRRQERERQRLEAEEQERKRLEEEERKRLLKEQQEREWLARQPKTCDRCGGNGQCLNCGGSGNVSTLYLVSRVTEESLLQYGRPLQGCDECGGRMQGILGEVLKGSGLCYACGGSGKIAPRSENTVFIRRPPAAFGSPATAPPGQAHYSLHGILHEDAGTPALSIPIPTGSPGIGASE
mmetsp:Transcript_56615/g.132855  ORF Transcript_56615/g.132855 Transcript_56615/m.132855 type:complete len:370 (-) Transcript_56615:48-1157(-)